MSIIKLFRHILLFLLLTTGAGCERLLEVDDPGSLIPREVIFMDDITATTAISGIYATLIESTSFSSGYYQSITALAGLSSDELANYKPTNVLPIQFYENNLQADNSQVAALWRTPYKVIYQANSAMESLKASTGLTGAIKDQLIGEALFMRAFCHFYLVNMFGRIPIVTTIDYRVNTRLSRSDAEAVYVQIVEDLKEAQKLLDNNYPSAQRVRVNKAAATALLARVYLYTGDWENAELQSSDVINNVSYQLEPDLNHVFLITSKEAIWQLMSNGPTQNTWEGTHFILTGAPSNFYLTTAFKNAFETNDKRSANWTNSIVANGTTFYYPFKYKIRTGGPGSATPIPLSECSVILRLAEQYLIRAEARVQLNDLSNAIDDIDSIRHRAGLPLIRQTDPDIDKEELLLAIERERRSELFTEWGHRWFDLKRTSRATAVLGPVKADWSETDQLYPVPANELINNQNLNPQNLGY